MGVAIDPTEGNLLHRPGHAKESSYWKMQSMADICYGSYGSSPGFAHMDSGWRIAEVALRPVAEAQDSSETTIVISPLSSLQSASFQRPIHQYCNFVQMQHSPRNTST